MKHSGGGNKKIPWKRTRNQNELLENVTTQVYDALEQFSSRFTVAIPYDMTRDNILQVAEWLAVNFPRSVKCIHNHHFITLSPRTLVPAHTYYVDLQ